MQAQRPMIMVVEDEETIRNQLAEALPMMGFEVSLAVDGFDALHKLETCQPDLILSDIVMPGISGLDLKKELAKVDRLATIPFVFVSALSSLYHVREGMQLAADDYVTKPYRLHELKTVIDAQLEKAQARSRHFNQTVDGLVESLQLIFPHEIITPITVIYGFADFLKTLDQSNPKEQKLMAEMLDGITTAAKRLRRMTDRFTESVKSNLHKVQAGRELLKEPFAYEISETVRSASEQVAAERSAINRLEFRLAPGQVSVYREAVMRIVSEIIKNAIDYSPSNSFVSISGHADGKSYFLVVRDQGPGMSSEEIARIGMFVQFGRRAREQQGLGIGLAISKRFSELIGAKISFASSNNQGLEVRIRIPLDEDILPSTN